MLIIPAIDLKDGCVVRYVQGARDKKIYSRDPLKTARHWVKQGAKLIHIVDLDGAFSGVPKNLSIVEKIVRNIKVPVQFGGGVRRVETIDKLVKIGVRRVILGTRAVKDERFLKKVFKKFNDKVIVSVDAKAGRVAIDGWLKDYKKMSSLNFIEYLKNIGFNQLIYTDISKDGTLSGPNIPGIKKLLAESRMKIIASGGISSLEDLYKLKKLQKQGLLGVIIGKALYEGKFTLKQAMNI